MEQATKKKLTVAAVLGAMGPGLLAALSGNDAGGIATYSSAGASYGYATLWMLPVMALLLIVVQETAARCGCVTGKGFASLIREKFGVRKTALAMVALLIANTAVTISEFAGIASGLALFGIPKTVSVPLMGLLIWLLTMSGSFRRIEKILLLVSCVFVTYVVAAFLAGPNWGEVALSTVTPHLIPEPSYVSRGRRHCGDIRKRGDLFLRSVPQRREGPEYLRYLAHVRSGSAFRHRLYGDRLVAASVGCDRGHGTSN